MKKLLPLILFLLIASSQAWANTYLASTCAGSLDSKTVTTSAINTTGASLIVISVGYYAPGTKTTPTDSAAGNTWTALNTYESSGNGGIIYYYMLNPTTSASHTFTENNGSTANYPEICVIAFSGPTAVDQQNGNSQNSGTTISTGSITPGSNNEVLITSIMSGAAGAAPSAVTGGYTFPSSVAGVSSENNGGGIAYLLQTTATASNPQWTYPSGITATNIVSFNGTASGGATSSTTTIGNSNIGNGQTP